MIDIEKEKMKNYHIGIAFIYKKLRNEKDNYKQLINYISTISTDDLKTLVEHINEVNDDIKNQNIKDLDNYLKINNDIISIINIVLDSREEDNMNKTSVSNIMDCYNKLDFLYTSYKSTKCFKEKDLIQLLSVFNKEELEMFKKYIENINYDLYYDYEMGIKKNYDGIESKNNYFIELIDKLIQSKRKRD